MAALRRGCEIAEPLIEAALQEGHDGASREFMLIESPEAVAERGDEQRGDGGSLQEPKIAAKAGHFVGQGEQLAEEWPGAERLEEQGVDCRHQERDRVSAA